MNKTRKELKEAIIKQQEHIDTMSRIMSNCYSDEAYRAYSRNLEGFIQNKIKLEDELERLKNDKRRTI